MRKGKDALLERRKVAYKNLINQREWRVKKLTGEKDERTIQWLKSGIDRIDREMKTLESHDAHK